VKQTKHKIDSLRQAERLQWKT